HERGFPEGRAEIALTAVLCDGIFADEDLRPLAVVSVVAVRLPDEELGIAVVMFVDEVGSGIGRVTVPHVGDELYLGMPFLDGLVEERPAFVVGGTAVLITDLHVPQVKRRGLAVS